MKTKSSESGLFESGFDQDIAPEQLKQLIEIFPTEDAVHENILSFRRSKGYVDMKRGELYPEIIGGVGRLRRTIAEAYGIDISQAQSNFACNGCIDALMVYVRIAWSAQRCSEMRTLLKEIKNIFDSGNTPDLHVLKRAGTIPDSGQRPTLIVASPTYFRYYSATESKRIRLVTIPFRSDYSYPTEEVLEAVNREKAFGLILVSPNNPTGMAIPDAVLRDIISGVPDDCIVALDRTCVNVIHEVPTADLLKQHASSRLVVFHSFSKYYSMSHIRIGFSVFSNRDFAKEVEPMLPFGLNLEGILKATKILSRGPLKPSSHVLKNVQINQQLIRKFLSESPGYSVTPFSSNYALMQLPPELTSDIFAQAMLSKGIFIMPGHEFPEPNPRWVRIHTGGLPETTEKLIEAIENELGGR